MDASRIESRLARSKSPRRNRLHGAVPPFQAFQGLFAPVDVSSAGRRHLV